MKTLIHIFAACILFGTVPTVAADMPVLSASASYLTAAMWMQARPVRPQPASRPRQPVTRPATPTRQPNNDVRVTDRLFQERVEAIEEAADRLVERTRRALNKNKRPDRLIRRLERDYQLTFVEIDGRHTLVRYRELIGVNLQTADLNIAHTLGFKRYHSTVLPAAGMRIDLLQVPETLAMQDTIDRLRRAGATGFFTFNSMFGPAGRVFALQAARGDAQADESHTALSGQAGMVDTGVNAKHKLLIEGSIVQRNFGRSSETTPRNHGTAIASILSGKGVQKLFVADVFSGPILFADVESIVLAMDWLAGEGVGVLNMSLAGPPNPLMQLAVSRLTGRGHIIVAAAGNNGADGEALYPASYDNVVGVTAVDKNNRIFKKAHQGRAVDYAAFGVKLRAAALKGRKRYSGTSFAAPMVSAFIATKYATPEPEQIDGVFKLLDNNVQDGGVPGRDPVFGVGILVDR